MPTPRDLVFCTVVGMLACSPPTSSSSGGPAYTAGDFTAPIFGDREFDPEWDCEPTIYDRFPGLKIAVNLETVIDVGQIYMYDACPNWISPYAVSQPRPIPAGSELTAFIRFGWHYVVAYEKVEFEGWLHSGTPARLDVDTRCHYYGATFVHGGTPLIVIDKMEHTNPAGTNDCGPVTLPEVWNGP